MVLRGSKQKIQNPWPTFFWVSPNTEFWLLNGSILVWKVSIPVWKEYLPAGMDSFHCWKTYTVKLLSEPKTYASLNNQSQTKQWQIATFHHIYLSSEIFKRRVKVLSFSQIWKADCCWSHFKYRGWLSDRAGWFSYLMGNNGQTVMSIGIQPYGFDIPRYICSREPPSQVSRQNYDESQSIKS